MTDFSRRDFFKLLATSTLSLNYTGITQEAKKFRQLWQKRISMQCRRLLVYEFSFCKNDR